MIESFEKIIDPNFLSAEIIGGIGSFKVVTIKDIDYLEAFNSKTNGKEQKQCLILEGTKPLILNKTNAKQLKKMFSPNEDNPALCVGKTVELYVVETKVGRNMTTGIRIREHSAEICEECGKEIKPAASRTVAQLVEISKRNTGKKMCLACMQAFANRTKEVTNE